MEHNLEQNSLFSSRMCKGLFVIRNGNIAACSKHSRRLPGYKHNDIHRTTKVAWQRRPCLFILIVTNGFFVCLSFIIDCFVAFINIYVLLHLCHLLSHTQSFSVLTAYQRACLGITGVPSLVSNFAQRTHAHIKSYKKRCILRPFKLTSDLFLLVNTFVLGPS